MIIHTGIDIVPLYPYPVVTMGNFDGVHDGHKKIISEVVARAQKNHGTSIVLTYWPHSKVYFGVMQEKELLQTLDERLDAIKKLGVDVVIVFPFTDTFSQIPAETFIETVLIEKIGIKEIVIGYDSVFGKDKKGNRALLETYSTRGAFTVFQVDPLVDSTGEIISSTSLRQA